MSAAERARHLSTFVAESYPPPLPQHLPPMPSASERFAAAMQKQQELLAQDQRLAMLQQQQAQQQQAQQQWPQLGLPNQWSQQQWPQTHGLQQQALRQQRPQQQSLLIDPFSADATPLLPARDFDPFESLVLNQQVRDDDDDSSSDSSSGSSSGDSGSTVSSSVIDSSAAGGKRLTAPPPPVSASKGAPRIVKAPSPTATGGPAPSPTATPTARGGAASVPAATGNSAPTLAPAAQAVPAPMPVPAKQKAPARPTAAAPILAAPVTAAPPPQVAAAAATTATVAAAATPPKLAPTTATPTPKTAETPIAPALPDEPRGIMDQTMAFMKRNFWPILTVIVLLIAIGVAFIYFANRPRGDAGTPTVAVPVIKPPSQPGGAAQWSDPGDTVPAVTASAATATRPSRDTATKNSETTEESQEKLLSFAELQQRLALIEKEMENASKTRQSHVAEITKLQEMCEQLCDDRQALQDQNQQLSEIIVQSGLLEIDNNTGDGDVLETETPVTAVEAAPVVVEEPFDEQQNAVTGGAEQTDFEGEAIDITSIEESAHRPPTPANTGNNINNSVESATATAAAANATTATTTSVAAATATATETATATTAAAATTTNNAISPAAAAAAAAAATAAAAAAAATTAASMPRPATPVPSLQNESNEIEARRDLEEEINAEAGENDEEGPVTFPWQK